MGPVNATQAKDYLQTGAFQTLITTVKKIAPHDVQFEKHLRDVIVRGLLQKPESDVIEMVELYSRTFEPQKLLTDMLNPAGPDAQKRLDEQGATEKCFNIL